MKPLSKVGNIGLRAPQNTFLDEIISRFNKNDLIFVIGNQNLSGFPIVHTSNAFTTFFGYKKEETLWQSIFGEFLTGELTDRHKLNYIRDNLEKNLSGKVTIALYTRTGREVLMCLDMSPVFNVSNEPILYLMVFQEIRPTFTKKPLHKHMIKSLRIKLAQPSSSNIKPSVLSLMNLNDEPLPKYKLDVPKKGSYIIFHYGKYKISWDWVIILLIFYTAIVEPFYVSFNVGRNNLGISITEYIIDAVFLTDLILSFRTTYVSQTGKIIADPKLIRLHYLKTYFVIDLLSFLPYNAIEYMRSNLSNRGAELLTMLKVGKMLRMVKVVKKMDHYLQYGAAVLVMLICAFLVFAHWFACIWYVIGRTEVGLEYGWLSQVMRNTNSSGIKMFYVSSIYYTMTCMTSIGFGNIAPNTFNEKLFTLFMMIIGSLLYASIFSNITTIFGQIYSNTGKFQSMMQNVREFMRLNEIPNWLSVKITDYMLSSWSVDKGINSEKIIKSCPVNIQRDIYFTMFKPIVLSRDVFEDIDEEILKDVACIISIYNASPEEILCHEGEEFASIVFIVKGSVEIVQNGQIVAILSENDTFGSNLKVTRDVSYCVVRAMTYCDLRFLNKKKLRSIYSLNNCLEKLTNLQYFPTYRVDDIHQVVTHREFSVNKKYYKKSKFSKMSMDIISAPIKRTESYSDSDDCQDVQKMVRNLQKDVTRLQDMIAENITNQEKILSFINK